MSNLDVSPQDPTTTVRRLRRSRTDHVFGGVCGGVARYLDVDSVLLRLAAVALALSGGLGILAYLIAWIVIPAEDGPEPPRTAKPVNRHAAALVVGALLVAAGGLLLINQLVPWFSGAVLWPIVPVAVGATVIASAVR